MILQALTEYYRALERQGKIAAPGWGPVKVSFALCIGDDGTLQQAVSVQTEQVRGKKTVLAPRVVSLPAPVKRTVGVAANFLCDNSSYMLGVDDKGKPERTRLCFEACKALHEQALDGVDSPAARAILAFFRAWEPEKARENAALLEHLEEILAGGNLVFRTEEGFVHDDPAVRRAWEAYYNTSGDGPQGVCLVTGEQGPIESVHPAIKNVAGAQSSGAALVSFNAPAFCSYGKEQNLNAPTGKYAAFAYTAALNHLLADREHVYRVGDATVVCWAKGGGSFYQSLFGWAAMGQSEPSYDESELRGMVKRLCRGEAVDFHAERLDPGMDFYVLGLSPNASRLSVRFFLRNTFGGFLRNAEAHQERLKIVRRKDDNFDALPIWRLVQETVRKALPGARPAEANPRLAGDLLLAVLNDAPYPATLLNGVVLRIRAERTVTRGKAAILKAYYLNNSKDEQLKEVLTVELNETTNYLPYVLGRLFSVLENVQLQVNPRINTTITDRYFNSASATPAVVFPTLINLAQKHLAKMNKGQDIYFQKQISELCSRITQTLPARMSLSEQSAFQLGYYHETQNRYKPKEEKNNV